MKKRIILGVLSLCLLLSACKSEFEQLRASGDVQNIYQSALKFYDEGEFQKAQTLFELVISSFRGQREAEEIYFKYAYTYYNLEQYLLASYYFKNFANTYATSDFREEADFMAAYAHYQLSPTFRLDQTYTEQAIEEFQLFVNTYPNSERAKQCNSLIDGMRKKLEIKAIEGANLYFDLRDYQASIQSYENLLKDFPDTENAEQIRYMIAKSAYLLAKNSFVERQKERYEVARDRSAEFLKRYPKSSFLKEVANFNEESEKSLKALNNDRYQNQSSRT